MRNASRRSGLIVALALLAGAACDRDRADEAAEPAPTGSAPLTDLTLPLQPDSGLPPLPPESIPPRAGTLRDTLLIEGMGEPVTMTLLRPPAGFGIPFTTYLPPGLRADFELHGDTSAVRFSAAFGGHLDENAYMHVRMYAPGSTDKVVRDLATAFIRSRAPWRDEAQPAPPAAWADEAYTYQYSGDGAVPYTGRLVIARHRGRYFHVLTHYPAEYGDGLGPRFASVLGHWRWEDTGRPLYQAPDS
jgi:hypothetical protein